MKTHTTGSMTGVDFGKLPWPSTIPEDTKKFNLRLYEKTDFAEFDPHDIPKGGWDLVTSFEVLEHMQPYSSYLVLKRMRDLVRSEGYTIISTPNYDAKVGAAENHINELTYDALYALITASGWEVEKVYGTFASQKDYKKSLTLDQLDFMKRLQEFYDSTLISNIMGPMIDPWKARNCMWVLRPGQVSTDLLKDKFRADKDNSSSTKWKAARNKILRELKGERK